MSYIITDAHLMAVREQRPKAFATYNNRHLYNLANGLNLTPFEYYSSGYKPEDFYLWVQADKEWFNRLMLIEEPKFMDTELIKVVYKYRKLKLYPWDSLGLDPRINTPDDLPTPELAHNMRGLIQATRDAYKKESLPAWDHWYDKIERGIIDDTWSYHAQQIKLFREHWRPHLGQLMPSDAAGGGAVFNKILFGSKFARSFKDHYEGSVVIQYRRVAGY